MWSLSFKFHVDSVNSERGRLHITLYRVCACFFCCAFSANGLCTGVWCGRFVFSMQVCDVHDSHEGGHGKAFAVGRVGTSVPIDVQWRRAHGIRNKTYGDVLKHNGAFVFGSCVMSSVRVAYPAQHIFICLVSCVHCGRCVVGDAIRGSIALIVQMHARVLACPKPYGRRVA